MNADLGTVSTLSNDVAMVEAGVTNAIVQLAEKGSMSQDGIRYRRRAPIRREILTLADPSLGRPDGRLTAWPPVDLPFFALIS